MKKYPIKLSDEEIINIYLQTKSLRQTALASQGITSTATIAKKLRSLGIEVKNYKLKPIKVSDEVLIELYNSGKSLMEIAKIVSDSKGAMSVRKKLQSLGINTSYENNIDKYREKMSRNFHKYTLNEQVFDCVDTEEKAYWLGFLMADGYNHANKNAICLRLQKEDKEILEKFKVFLETDAPIYQFKRITRVNKLEKEYCELRCNSIHLSNRLTELGCVQGKTYTLEFPDIPECLYNHFIRGFFDGDGCISIRPRHNRPSNSYQLNFTGKESVMLKVQEIICNQTKVTKTKIRKHKNNFAVTISWSGRLVCKRILDYLYKDATIFLTRKYNKYLQCGNSAE